MLSCISQVFFAYCRRRNKVHLISCIAGATSGTICNLCNSSNIRKKCCEMGFLQRLIALVSQNEVFSTRHASGALWNLIVDNDDAKLLIGSDESFRAKLTELFTNSDHQVPHAVARAVARGSEHSVSRCRCRSMRLASPAKCAAETFKSRNCFATISLWCAL
jgi:hypothetical protein